MSVMDCMFVSLPITEKTKDRKIIIFSFDHYNRLDPRWYYGVYNGYGKCKSKSASCPEGK